MCEDFKTLSLFGGNIHVFTQSTIFNSILIFTLITINTYSVGIWCFIYSGLIFILHYKYYIM